MGAASSVHPDCGLSEVSPCHVGLLSPMLLSFLKMPLLPLDSINHYAVPGFGADWEARVGDFVQKTSGPVDTHFGVWGTQEA